MTRAAGTVLGTALKRCEKGQGEEEWTGINEIVDLYSLGPEYSWYAELLSERKKINHGDYAQPFPSHGPSLEHLPSVRLAHPSRLSSTSRGAIVFLGSEDWDAENDIPQIRSHLGFCI